MVEVVIKIPEREYEELKRHRETFEAIKKIHGENGNGYFSYEMTVYDGTLLPKGHGRLIDANELEECKEMMDTISDGSKYAVRMDDIRNMSTIIEADTESIDGVKLISVTDLYDKIAEIGRRIDELEGKMDLIQSRSDLLQSSEERYYN